MSSIAAYAVRPGTRTPRVLPAVAVPHHRLPAAQYALVMYLLDVIRRNDAAEWHPVLRREALQAYTGRVSRPGRRVGQIVQRGIRAQRLYRLNRLARAQGEPLRQPHIVTEALTGLINAGHVFVVEINGEDCLQVTPSALANC